MRHRKRNISRALCIGIFCVAVLLSGCAAPTVIQTESQGANITHSSMQAPQEHPDPLPLKRADSGSLWVDNGSIGEMFINAKARRVGDIVTIKIVETSSASNEASTDTDRSSSLDVGLNTLFNLENNLSSESSFFNPFSPAGVSYKGKFGGAGKTERKGALTAYITARIIQILPNGNIMIEGNREVRVNNENQVITLTGQVRPRDISASNIIQSTFIADAKISYSGTGIVHDQQRPGWLARILDNIWPF